jgi:Protein of unknown function (DUF2849)
MAIQIVTANRLRDGAVVYLGPGPGLVEALEAAWRLSTKHEVEAALAEAARYVARQVVVNPYPIEVAETGGGLKPVRMREIIRAAGPTVRHDLGKQAKSPRTA